MTAPTTTAWAITVPQNGLLTFTVGRNRVEAIGKFLELFYSITPRCPRRLTEEQRNAWRRVKRRRRARAVRVQISQIEKSKKEGDA